MFKGFLVTLFGFLAFSLGANPAAAQQAAQWNYDFQSNVATAHYPGNVQIPGLGTANCLSTVAGLLTASSCSPGSGSVTNAMLATMPALTVKANQTTGTASPTDVLLTNATGVVSAASYGVKCDGTTDDAAAINAAIAALPATGGIIVFPSTGSPCDIGSTITIGNGTSSANSSVNGIALVGGGSGNSASESSPVGGPTTFKWTGSAAGTAVTVAGPISGVKLSGIVVDCNSLCATGFNLVHPMASRFEELLVENWTGSAYIWTAYPNGTSLATGSQHNTFIQIRAENPVASSGASGITIGANAYGSSPHLDAALSSFIGGQFSYDGLSAGAYGIQLQFADNIDFLGVSTGHQGGSLGTALKIVPPSGSTLFPGAISFFHTALIGNVNNPGSGWTATNGVAFYGYDQGDGEAIPVANGIRQYFGYTTSGLTFGPTGTSGGIPYYSAAGALNTSGVLATNALVAGGGTGATPFSTGCSASGSDFSNVICTSSNSTAPAFGFTNNTSDSGSAGIVFQKSRSLGNVLTGDHLGDVFFEPFQSGAYTFNTKVSGIVDGAPSGANVPTKFVFQNGNTAGTATTETFDSKGHLGFTPVSVPTITSCGGSPSAATGSDVAGQVTEGSTATGCTITFATAYASAPFCVVGMQTEQAAFSYTLSASAIVVTNTSATNDKINWICHGN